MAQTHWLQLSLTTGLGPILIRRLIDFAGSPQRAVDLPVADLQQIEGIGIPKARTIHQSLRASVSAVEQQLKQVADHNATVITFEDDAYPQLLRQISDPPPVLYVRGTLEPRDLQSVAIVGSRRCSYYGREQAERFASLLAGAGFTVTSGGARGVDSAAHRGAMQHPQGRTIAVMGCGLDIVYPPENAALFEQIAQRGALISEFPFGTPPSPERFPQRNRVVSGMSRGVFVIEADERSGALITARLANEDQGRPVFALPGRIDNIMSHGPNQLIRDGAALVTRLEDIIDALDPLPDSVTQPTLFESPEPAPVVATAPASVSLTPRQALILGAFDNETGSVDQHVERTNLDASAILQELTFLSLKAVIRRVDGQTYARRKDPAR